MLELKNQGELSNRRGPPLHAGAVATQDPQVPGALQSTPPASGPQAGDTQEAWELLEHTPATEPIPLVALESKAAQYAQLRTRRHADLERSPLTILKTGGPVNATPAGQEPDQLLVEVKLANRKVYFHGYFISLPSSLAGRQYYRSITDYEFLLADPDTGEIVFSFPLPMVALHVRGRYVASYSIRGAQLTYPNKLWASKHADFKAQFEQRQERTPRVFECS